MNKKRILVVPTEFKESFSAKAVARTIADTLRNNLPADVYEIIERPVSDGGDGFLETLSSISEMESVELSVPALYDTNKTFGTRIAYDSKEKIAYLESAEIFGLKRTPKEKRNPLFLTSYGLGIALKTLSEKNKTNELEIRKVIVGLGGSAIHDAGLGLASAFGLRIIKCGRALPVFPKFFLRADSVKYVRNNFKLGFDLEIIADVENPLTGKNNATEVFAAQKGATREEILLLKKGIENILRLLRAEGTDKFSGSAGGSAFALKYFFDAKVVSAEEFIYKKYLSGIDDVCCGITGEGKLDDQTLSGKAPFVVYKFLKKKGAKTVFITGENLLGNSHDFYIIETAGFYETIKDSLKNPGLGIAEATKKAISIITENN